MAGARLARNEGQRAVARRSLTSTVPADTPAPSHAWLSDRPSWCVDLGHTLVAMTTCELWLALAGGHVTPKAKVWREGMPCWDAIEHVPEFALALPDAKVFGPDRLSGEHGPARVSGEHGPARVSGEHGPAVAAPVIEEAPPSAMAASVVAASDLVTPAPVVVEAAPIPLVQQKPALAWPKIDRRGALSVAAGAAVAIAALVIATTGPAPAQPARAAAAAMVTPPEKANARVLHKLPRGPRAADKGQRRAR